MDKKSLILYGKESFDILLIKEDEEIGPYEGEEYEWKMCKENEEKGDGC